MQELYAYKKDGVFHHFFPSVMQVKMFGVESNIFRVSLRLSDTNEQSIYWAWLDSRDNEFNFIYPYRKAVEICFPYGYQVEEKLGRGKLVQVMVTELREVI